MDVEHDQAFWSDGPKTQSQTHTSTRKSMHDMDLLEYKKRVHLTDQVGAPHWAADPYPSRRGDGVRMDVEGCPCPWV